MIVALQYGLIAYALLGLATAIAFVSTGLTRALPQPSTFTWGARLLLLPGAFALWPYILARWLCAPRLR